MGGIRPMGGILRPTGDCISLVATVQNNHEPSQSEGKNVKSLITNRQLDEKGNPVQVLRCRKSVRVIQSSLIGAEVLALSEDDNRGADPYNNTGQHVIIKMKSASQD